MQYPQTGGVHPPNFLTMYKPLLTAAICCCNFLCAAQATTDSSPRKLRFGFNFGSNYSFLHSKEKLPENTSIYNGFGGKLGLVMDYAISNQLAISPKIDLAFNNSKIETTHNSELKSTYKVFANSLDIMSHITFKLSKNPKSLYIIAGPNLRLPVEKKPESISTFTTKTDIALDFGFGIENPFKHFSIAPEIRYSLGLLNINNNPLYKSLHYHNVSLVIAFR
jgi:Outer membrane protein beta-barrel domain